MAPRSEPSLQALSLFFYNRLETQESIVSQASDVTLSDGQTAILPLRLRSQQWLTATSGLGDQ
jgi:hypothetical protein